MNRDSKTVVSIRERGLLIRQSWVLQRLLMAGPLLPEIPLQLDHNPTRKNTLARSTDQSVPPADNSHAPRDAGRTCEPFKLIPKRHMKLPELACRVFSFPNPRQ